MPLESPPLIPQETLEWIEHLREKYCIPGLAVGVISKSSTRTSEWEKQFHTSGIRNPRGDRYDTKTVFAIGSCSKAFAYLSLALLIHRQTKLPSGQILTWRTRVQDVLGDIWKLPDEYATSHATVNDLSGMVLGLSPHPYARAPINPARSCADQLRMIRHLSMSTELRQVFSYDSFCPLACSVMVEILSGISYLKFLHKEIFEPLGMHSAYASSLDTLNSGRYASGYLRKIGRRESGGAPNPGKAYPIGWWTTDDGAWMAPAGGLAMTIEDSITFLQELLEPRQLPENILEADPSGCGNMSTVSAMSLQADCPQLYGRGQIITTYRGHKVAWHPGFMPGQVCTMLRVPQQKIGLAIAINDGSSIGTPLMNAIRQRLLDDLLGMPYTDDYVLKMVTPALNIPLADPDQEQNPNPEAIKVGGVIIPGLYHNAAYRTLEPLPMDSNSPIVEAMVDACQAKGWFSDFDSDCFMAQGPSFWLSYLVFRPTVKVNDSICICEWYGFQMYAIEGANDEFVALVRSKGRCVCTADGVGMFEGLANPFTADARPVPQDLEANAAAIADQAEVWFARVK